jgi:hypothetical protein
MDGGFYRYDGSLTTPPCSQTVKCFVMQSHLMVCQAPVGASQHCAGQGINNRPGQLPNGHGIFKDTYPGCHVEYSQRRLASGSAPWGFVLPQCWPQQYPQCAGSQQSPIE